MKITILGLAMLAAASLTGCQSAHPHGDYGSVGPAFEYGAVQNSFQVNELSPDFDAFAGGDARHSNRATRELQAIPD